LSMRDPDKAVGITTTIPIEIVFAAGHRPLDLNNAFITSPSAARMVEDAEAEWEYAARAGSQDVRWWGDEWKEGFARGDVTPEEGTVPVGSYTPSPFGLTT
jgi:hypothetical protein